MLKLAYPYQDALNQVWQACVLQEKYQFYNPVNFWSYTIDLSNSSWDSIQMVSVDNDDGILGYFTAYIDRISRKVSNIGAINFGTLSITFSKDFYQFLIELFTKHHFRKVEWNVVIGNPAERMYDKIVAKYGGRIVGVRRESTTTADGVLRDEKLYEIFQCDYFERQANRKKGRGIET
jgi:hypothetical protein